MRFPMILTRPGHVLPIRCADGGFAERARSWELAVDLVSGAGHPPVAVVCRLIDDERGDPLDEMSATVFALCHDMHPVRLPAARMRE